MLSRVPEEFSIGVSTNCPKHSNANIVNLVLAVALEIN